jgi:2-amino-4-hydroxy-6-hydroxymethyldihydropteridine diphosphokinase
LFPQEHDAERKGDADLILVGLGANLPSRYGPPRVTLAAALDRLAQEGLAVRRRSSFWRSRPVPTADQPWFSNAVAAVDCDLSPAALLVLLHRIEADFGRIRTTVNAARVLDLDLLAYGRLIDPGPRPVVPHPRLAERSFVLLPLSEIAPTWRHPVTGDDLPAMIARLPADQVAELDD